MYGEPDYKLISQMQCETETHYISSNDIHVNPPGRSSRETPSKRPYLSQSICLPRARLQFPTFRRFSLQFSCDENNVQNGKQMDVILVFWTSKYLAIFKEEEIWLQNNYTPNLPLVWKEGDLHPSSSKRLTGMSYVNVV